MDWKLFWMTFSSILIAELGDKTQLSVLAFAGQSKSLWTVFTAASFALILATLIGALAGSFLSRYIDPKYIRICGGLPFIMIGIWMIWKGE